MATATRPTVTVQVAFDDGALVVTPTWTTIPARSISVNRGRSDETQRFGPGTATVVVPNATRLFDPTNSAGTYFGKLLPMRQLRIRATYNAVTYEIFRGHVEGWPQKYNESNRDGYVELVANDALTYLSNVDLPTWTSYVPQLAQPTWWYPLDDNNDGEDYDTAREIVAGANGVYQHDDINAFIDFSQPPLAPTGESVNFDGGSLRLSAFPTSSTFAVAFSFRRTTRPNGASLEILFDAGYSIVSNSHNGMFIGVNSSGFIDCFFEAGAEIIGTADLCDGIPHSVVALCAPGSNATQVWVDGVSIGTETVVGGSPYLRAPMVGDANAGVRVFIPTYLPCTRTQVDEVMIWNAPSGFATDAPNLGLAMIAWYGQTPAERIDSLLDVAGWPSALRSISSNGPALGPVSLGGRLLADLQIAEASEAGRLFVDVAGNVVLHGRWRDRTDSSATSSQATFADDGADHKYLARGFEYGYEVDRLVTSCSVSGWNVEATATDATAVAAYGVRSRSISTLLLNVNEARNLAEYIVLRYKAPVLRVKQFSVNAERAPATMWPAVLSLEIGDRVTLQRTPQRVGAQISTALLVERIQHDIDQDKWETKLLGSPVDPNTESPTTYWVLGTSAFDSETVLYF